MRDSLKKWASDVTFAGQAPVGALGTDEATVGDLADRLGFTQPQVSKHLAVLRAVGLVSVRADGRRRWYRVNGTALEPVFEWVRGFESTGDTRLDRLDDVLVELQTKENLA
jgi:DNA-binding transcriptional ArsR family regulator